MEHAADPWFIALIIVLVITTFVVLYAIRDLLRDWIVLAMAIPPALFKKLLGPPRH
jgi:hypothetical protein